MGNTYVCSDLHGMGKIWFKMKEFLKKDDTLICLGDVIDRGQDGLVMLLDMVQDPRVFLLKGNHEDLMVKEAENLYKTFSAIYSGDFVDEKLSSIESCWLANGGEPTFEQFCYLNEKDRKGLIEILNSLPTYIEYHSKTSNDIFYLSHAGFTPNKEKNNYDLLWDRKHIEDPWPKEPDYENVFIIHGHTPVQYFARTKEEACSAQVIYYADGHKINLDMGSVCSHKAVLFNLNTFDEIYFVE